MHAAIEANGMAVLEKRYLDGGTVDQLWSRVSGGNERFRSLLDRLLFVPNSPTLFNAGQNNGCTLSACFVFSIKDTMDSICEVRTKACRVAKAGGGVGYYGGHLRPKGSLIKTIQRKACGPVAVLRDYNGVAKLITQGGKRELAQMFVLPVHHADVREFIHCKDKDPQSLSSFNISVGWQREEVKAPDFADLWTEQCTSAWKHGCPGMWFPDTVNAANLNLHLGLLEAPNPCGETPNRDNEPCKLGSIPLGRFVTSQRIIDWSLLEEVVVIASEFLDYNTDTDVFPHPDITAASLLTRKLGLGVMGWADMLGMLHIHYDTPEALTVADRVMNFIAEVSHATSERLGKEKGPYPGWSDRSKHSLRRNETSTSIAPTGTIHIIAGCKGSSIEPWFAEDDTRKTGDGLVLQEPVPAWIKEKLDGFQPKCAHEIGWRDHVRMQAAFQKHTDLGVSKTINMPNSATVAEVSDAYKLMHELDCKGGTIYREGSREEYGGEAVLTRKTFLPGKVQEKPPQERPGNTVELAVGRQKLFLTHNVYPDGRLCEIFVAGDFGSTIGGLLDSFCICFSIALQHGTPVKELCRHHIGKRFEPNGLVDHKDIKVCTSMVDAVCRLLLLHHAPEAERVSKQSGMVCPDCGSVAFMEAGCLVCKNAGCGWSRCG